MTSLSSLIRSLPWRHAIVCRLAEAKIAAEAAAALARMAAAQAAADLQRAALEMTKVFYFRARVRGYEESSEGTRVRGYEGTRVREYEGTRVRGYEGTRVRGYEDEGTRR